MNPRMAYDTIALQWPAHRGYAAPEDFCAIFEQEMDALYSLAFLLAGDRPEAEKCFLAALDDCQKSTGIFAEWASSWSRRAIIKQAIRQVHPRPVTENLAEPAQAPEEIEDLPRRLLRLRPFERFVFAMTVLERYSDRECATLLGCLARDVQTARIRALQFLGGSKGSALAMHFAGSYRQEPSAMANIGGNV